MDASNVALGALASVFSLAGVTGYLGWAYLAVVSIAFLVLEKESKEPAERAVNLIGFWGVSAMVLGIVASIAAVPFWLLTAVGLLSNANATSIVSVVFFLVAAAVPCCVLWKWVEG